MIKNLKKKKAFTLVEVIIVLAIIAIIAAIAIPNLTKVRQDSKRKADIQTCETIKRTVETLIVDESIVYDTAKATKIYIAPAASSTANATYTNLTASSTTVLPSDFGAYFKGLAKPQQDKGVGYVVDIDLAGTVTNVDTTSKNDGTLLNP